jgi:hypothetical protein
MMVGDVFRRRLLTKDGDVGAEDGGAAGAGAKVWMEGGATGGGSSAVVFIGTCLEGVNR